MSNNVSTFQFWLGKQQILLPYLWINTSHWTIYWLKQFVPINSCAKPSSFHDIIPSYLCIITLHDCVSDYLTEDNRRWADIRCNVFTHLNGTIPRCWEQQICCRLFQSAQNSPKILSRAASPSLNRVWKSTVCFLPLHCMCVFVLLV